MTKRFIAFSILILFITGLLTSMALSDEIRLIVFPSISIRKIDKKEAIEEPSGIAWHPARKTLFVVSDDGDIYEIDADGKILNQKRLPHGKRDDIDPEGVTVNTRTGNLYVASEEGDDILEVDPRTFEILGYYDIVSKKELLRHGGNGIEGIAYVPGKKAEDDRVYVVNQDDPPIVMKVALPRKPKGNAVQKEPVPVIGYFKMPVSDLSGITYYSSRKTLFILSDTNNALFEVTTAGKIVNQWAIPGKDQEGIAFDKTFMYITQDSGKILKISYDKSFEPKSVK